MNFTATIVLAKLSQFFREIEVLSRATNKTSLTMLKFDTFGAIYRKNEVSNGEKLGIKLLKSLEKPEQY